MTRSSRSLRLGLLAIAGLGAMTLGATIGQAAPAAAAGTSMVIPVDRQDYVTAFTTTNPSDGSTVDPYDADPSSIHVAINGGKEFARSFVHIALDYMPTGATPTALTMTLHLTQQSDASNTGVYPAYNVNNSAAIVMACALTTELPRKFDSSQPPAYDCQHGSAVGKPNKAGDTWTFQLSGLLSYWASHGNTGAALVPVGSGDPNQNWAVAFYKSRSAANVVFTAPANTTPATGPGISAGSTATGPTGGSGTGSAPTGPSVGSGAVPPAGSSSVTGAPPVSAPAVAAPPSGRAPAAGTHRSGGSTPVWPWVLLGSLGLAGGSIAFAHREAILAAMPRGVAAFRTHPRAYAVASAALSWGLVFTTYSVVTQPAGHSGGQDLAGNSQNTQLSPGSTPGSTAPSALVNGKAATPGANAATTGTSGGATTGGQTTAGADAQRAAATEFNGPGTYKTINGVQVFFPSGGGPPVAKLYSGADDIIGLSPNQIRICAHAALSYGKAFHIDASDLDVFWQYVNDAGGIFGRKVTTNYQNDNYDPGTAVQAAQACKDWNTFLLLGGIGFDQIPAVRQWAEQNHELYLHHIATIQGSAGLRYSFSALPTVEQVGRWFGQLTVHQFKGKKIGILYRQSSNWSPGVDTFTQVVKAAGMQIVGSYGVTINQGNYTQELAQLHTAGAQVIFAWENALSEIEMIKQAQGQNWHPAWLVNGFNIITNTLGSTALDQDMWSPAEWEAYDPGYYGGGFSSYADQIKEFEKEYKTKDPNADLTGDGGDLLFLNWESQKWLYDLLLACGKDCTRNKVAGLLLAGYHKITPPNCEANFDLTGDHHHGGYLVSELHAIRDPNGRANFVPLQRCVTQL